MAKSLLSGVFRRWITSIDSVLLFSTFALIAVGLWISIASTPAVAIKLGFSPFHFVKRHVLIAPIAVAIVVFISFLQTRHIRRWAIVGYVGCLFLIVVSLFFGNEVKGARRWLNICGISLQPSEFLKPILSIMTAWFIAEQYRDRKFPGIILSLVSIAIVTPLLLLQPDVGMAIIIVVSWVAQLFISGLSIFMIATFVLSSIGSLVGLYFAFPHFADRIDRFMVRDGDDVDLYQIQKSVDAFKSGGILGKGPGEGVIKTLVPDAHSDFVFSVIGEEFGFISCFVVILIFAVFISRALVKVADSPSIFKFSAVFGIVVQITMQTLINICTSLNIIPTKGMTLPFISYGGSSLLASAISVGIILALTKKNIMSQDVL
ncbi:MAG: putative lipid II flippase FtsW [Holosporales bacterium]|jgi:cell division protein FtsW|nr:putative lipid II flippase FtsW [Holosporales bacterium]